MTAAGALGVLLSVPLTAVQAAAVTDVARVVAVPALPRVVLGLHGLRLSDRAQADRASAPCLAAARRSLPWALAGAGALVVAAAAVLAAAVLAGFDGRRDRGGWRGRRYVPSRGWCPHLAASKTEADGRLPSRPGLLVVTITDICPRRWRPLLKPARGRVNQVRGDLFV